MTNTTPTLKVVGIINFHGLTLWVTDHKGIEYIPARALVDLAGIQWKRARQGLFNGDNAKLFGTIELIDPVFNTHSDTQVPKKQPYIRLDRARMYLARINTAQMRVNNNVDAADALLSLQVEWAEVLHSYETNGVAVKTSKLSVRQQEEKNLFNLFKTRKETTDGKEREAITAMIRDKLVELGYLLEDAEEPQQELAV